MRRRQRACNPVRMDVSMADNGELAEIRLIARNAVPYIDLNVFI
jgi:hypothetical protein